MIFEANPVRDFPGIPLISFLLLQINNLPSRHSVRWDPSQFGFCVSLLPVPEFSAKKFGPQGEAKYEGVASTVSSANGGCQGISTLNILSRSTSLCWGGLGGWGRIRVPIPCARLCFSTLHLTHLLLWRSRQTLKTAFEVSCSVG